MKRTNLYPEEYSMAYLTDTVPWILRRSRIIKNTTHDQTVIKVVSHNGSAVYFTLYLTYTFDKSYRVEPKITKAELVSGINRIILKNNYARELALLCCTNGTYQK